MRRWKRRRPPVALPVPVESPPPWDFDELAARVHGDPTPAARDVAPVADEQARPRLRIRRDPITGRWAWWVMPFPTKLLGHAATHREALAVGLANLAVHTATWAIDVHGTELSAGWEKITP